MFLRRCLQWVYPHVYGATSHLPLHSRFLRFCPRTKMIFHSFGNWKAHWGERSSNWPCNFDSALSTMVCMVALVFHRPVYKDSYHHDSYYHCNFHFLQLSLNYVCFWSMMICVPTWMTHRIFISWFVRINYFF